MLRHAPPWLRIVLVLIAGSSLRHLAAQPVPEPAIDDGRVRPAGAFEEYARLIEKRIEGDVATPNFLRLAQRPTGRARLLNGEILASPAAALGVKPAMAIPGGQVEHWVGAIFVPCTTLPKAIPRLQDYDQRTRFMWPEVVESRQLERQGDNFKVYLRLHEKSIVSGTFDAYLDITYRMLDDTRLLIQSRSEKIVEVQSPDAEEGAAARNRGLLWGLNHYWRIVEEDGGLYIECEALVLSRSLPSLLQWIADPLIAQAARKTLIGTLEATRRIVESER